jgi:hypothetical protein
MIRFRIGVEQEPRVCIEDLSGLPAATSDAAKSLQELTEASERRKRSTLEPLLTQVPSLTYTGAEVRRF